MLWPTEMNSSCIELQAKPSARVDSPHLDQMARVSLHQPRFCQTQSERRAVDWDRCLAVQRGDDMRQGTNMVLVAVGHHDAL